MFSEKKWFHVSNESIDQDQSAQTEVNRALDGLIAILIHRFSPKPYVVGTH